MTWKERIECDGDWCEPTAEEPPQVVESSDEWVEVLFDEYERHFCPVCSWRMHEWAIHGRSGGEFFTVQHNYIGEDFEEAHVGPGVDRDAVSNAGTHSMTVAPLIDEQNKYRDFEFGEEEAWHFHVFDHLQLDILGRHKEVPAVVVQPEEFPTNLEIRESIAGYSFDEIAVEKSIDVRWIDDG